MTHPRAILFTDADNTLWDTNAVYAEAQLGLLRAIEAATGHTSPEAEDRGLGFLRRLDQALAARHPDNLRYPAELLAAGLALALAGDLADQAAERVLATPAPAPFPEAVAGYIAMIGGKPRLRPGVSETFDALSNLDVTIVVVTEERRQRCEDLLVHHGLAGRVSHLVSERKTAALYKDLAAQYPAARRLMVGDQVDRDIIPAAQAGFETFHFPGAFTPHWAAGLEAQPTAILSRYDDLLPHLLRAAP